MTDVRHLWEYDHPYYCSAATWYKIDDHSNWESWADFRDDTLFINGDRDMNYLFRWDWRSWRRPIDPDDTPSEEPDELMLFFVMQRKGFLASHRILVTDEDEPAVRAFLADCAATVRDTWAPFLEAP